MGISKSACTPLLNFREEHYSQTVPVKHLRIIVMHSGLKHPNIPVHRVECVIEPFLFQFLTKQQNNIDNHLLYAGTLYVTFKNAIHHPVLCLRNIDQKPSILCVINYNSIEAMGVNMYNSTIPTVFAGDVPKRTLLVPACSSSSLHIGE